MYDQGKHGETPPRPHYIQQLPFEEEERLEKLFKQLDVNGDGRIDIHDLSKSLQKLGVPRGFGHAEKFIEKSDVAKSGYVDMAEFINYVLEHEKKLQLVFRSLDENKDGRIDKDELIGAFKKLGIGIDRSEAENLLRRMDKDGTLEIDFDEWRDYLLFHPGTELRDIIQYWRHATFIDIGEDTLVPDDFTEKEMTSGMWWRHLVAGGMAGAVSRTCTAPLDRLKVFLQVHGTRQFSSITGCLRHMLHEGGIKSLWRGNGINVLKIAPESAIKFMAYEQVKRFIRQNSNRDIGIHERFIAGSIAGGISQTVIYPLEFPAGEFGAHGAIFGSSVSLCLWSGSSTRNLYIGRMGPAKVFFSPLTVLKTRLALRKTGQYKGIIDAAMRIYKKEGFISFYRGYIPNLLGIIPYAGIDLAVYETLKKFYLRNHSEDGSPGVLVFLTCGTISSTCGQIASYPLALVRTRLQAQAVAELKTDATMTALFRNIVQTEGFPGLYRGIAPNFMKVAPAVSISYVVYERCREGLGVSMT